MRSALSELLTEIRACTACADLPLGPAPLVQGSSNSKILIVGQAPGRITHAKGIPFDDPSGNRLRDWLGVTREQFYDSELFAIAPMGFCFPGTATAGDLAPRAECAALWRTRLLEGFSSVELTVIIGRYAIDWHLPEVAGKPITEVAQRWEEWLPSKIVLPHPSPRNNRWLKSNPWFEAETLIALKRAVKRAVEM